jgi:hypothetical protein
VSNGHNAFVLFFNLDNFSFCVAAGSEQSVALGEVSAIALLRAISGLFLPCNTSLPEYMHLIKYLVHTTPLRILPLPSLLIGLHRIKQHHLPIHDHSEAAAA